VETLKLIFILIPALLEIIKLIEGMISGVKRGAEKKAAVMEIIGLVLRTVQKLGILGCIDPDKIMKAVDVLIDALVHILNVGGVFEHGREAASAG